MTFFFFARCSDFKVKLVTREEAVPCDGVFS